MDALSEGFEGCRLSVEMMLKSSETLLNSNNYSLSIFLSILAMEESTKLELIHKRMMTSDPIKKKEWKSISSYPEAHLNKLVTPVRDEKDSLLSMGKETYEKMKKIGTDSGIGELPDFDEIDSSDNINLSYYKMLNSIKKDCLYLDWNDNHWFSFFYLPEDKQKAFAKFRLNHTKQIVFNIILRNRLFLLTINQDSKKNQLRFSAEFELYKKLMRGVQENLISKNFEKDIDIANNLLKDYARLRMKKYVIDSDEGELVFSSKDIEELPDMFYQLYLMTGILPQKVLILKKQDIDLEKGTIASDFNGCEVCKIQTCLNKMTVKGQKNHYNVCIY